MHIKNIKNMQSNSYIFNIYVYIYIYIYIYKINLKGFFPNKFRDKHFSQFVTYALI